MKTLAASVFNSCRRSSRSWRCRAALVMTLAMAGGASGQPMPTDHSTHHHLATAPATQALADQVQELKAKVAQLDEALRRANPTAAMGQMAPGASMAGMPPAATGGIAPAPTGDPATMASMSGAPAAGANPMGGMMQEMGSMMQMMGGMMGGMKPGSAEMGGMKMTPPDMGGIKIGGGMAGMPAGPPMAKAAPGGMPAMGGMSGMGGMEKMDGMMGMPPAGGGMGGAGPMTAALPGFPGASHLYHIGSTGFFLDHAKHISLTVPQQAALNAVKEKALLAKAANQRKVDTAEQELWALTASDQPDATKIEAQLREVEKLRGDERLDFIRSVGDAAKILTDGQRQSLLGFQPPQPATAPAGAMAPM